MNPGPVVGGTKFDEPFPKLGMGCGASVRTGVGVFAGVPPPPPPGEIVRPGAGVGMTEWPLPGSMKPGPVVGGRYRPFPGDT